MDKRDDKYWIARCQSGDEQGYTMLYNRHAQSVYNAIFRLVNHSGEAEDLLQETFLTVFSALDKLAEVDHVGAWIRKVAVNRSISRLRRKKMQFEELKDEDMIDHMTGKFLQDGEDESMILECRIEELQATIERLPEVYRTIVVLHAFEGMLHKEIGQRLGLSEIAVRSQYHRARKMMLKQLTKYSYET